MRLAYVGVALAVAGSLWVPTTPAVHPSEVVRLEAGVTTYREVQDWWGQGELVGRSGPQCGGLRSRYALGAERVIELSWMLGVVCDWKVLTSETAQSGAIAASS